MELLLIEDHEEIGQNIVDYCESEGRAVDWYQSAQEVLPLINKHYRDCIVLDRMLPEMQGIDFLRYVRERSSVPIIMSTAMGTIDEKGAAYNNGVDDYLVKPYSLAELVMRIRAVVERSQGSDIIKLHELTIYIDQNRVVQGSKNIHLTTKERITFAVLLENMGSLVQRTTLIEAVWGDDQTREHDGALDVYIANLRKKLGKEIINTVKGVGYMIAR